MKINNKKMTMKRIKNNTQISGIAAERIIKDYDMSFYDILLRIEGTRTPYFRLHFYPDEKNGFIIRKGGIFKYHLPIGEDDDFVVFKIADKDRFSKNAIIRNFC